MKEIKRATGLLVIEVKDSNPNGDPDRESDPRQRPNGLGEISPVSFKRKLRDLVENKEGPIWSSLTEYAKYPEKYAILESRGRNRETIKSEMSQDTTEFNQKEFLESKFVKKYWDARIFGNTFLEEGADKGFIKTGVVQFGVGVSISPVNIVRHTNTSKASVQEGKNAGMAPLGFRFVEHGIYCMPFFVNPNYAGKSGCTSEDIDLMKHLIPYAYSANSSAIRTQIYIRHAWYVEHKNALGSCPDYLLIESLTPKRKDKQLEPSTSWNNYDDSPGLPDELKGKVEPICDLMNL
jgi:CRISPR-associated protein Csd2